MSVTTGVKRRRRRSGTISAAVLAVIALVLTGLALRYPGLSSSEVDVSNGGVWVMNGEQQLMGRLNVDAREFDARLSTSGEGLDILQSGYTVIETGPRGMTAINTASISRNAMVELPVGSEVKLGGDRVAVTAADGRVWILSPEEAGAFTPGAVEPTYQTKGTAPRVAVTSEGSVFILDGAQLLKFPRHDDTRKTKAEKPLEAGNVSTKPEMLELTTVGEQPVILDRERRLLRVGTELRDVDLTDQGVSDLTAARLQQGSPASDFVVLATEDTLFQVPLGRGEIIAHSARGTGNPVPPAQAKGCAYGAWNGSNTYVRACEGTDPVIDVVPEANSAGDLVLRVNHDLVILNDQKFGLSWMITEQMQLVKDWNIQQNIQTSETQEREEETLTSTITNIAAEREEKNRDPIANDDQFGVRAGQSVVLPVTRNDTDPDGDILTASVSGDQPTIGTVTPIRGGTQLQIVVNEDAAGSATFMYAVDDGRGGSATATVTLDVKPPEENSGPREADDRTTKVQVRSGQEVSFNILPYWEDPEGDAFYLANATIQPEDVVTFRPDGLITFTDAGLAPGNKQVQLTFRDEHGQAGEGVLEIESVTENDLAPITTADHVRVVTGRSATVKPLANDLNPNGGKLELTNVSDNEALEVDPVLEAGTVNVSGQAAGTYYLEYTVAASGSATASLGLIRVDVVDASSEELVPVAVDDMGTVTTGTDTLIDPLENDVDPTGGVLVVNSVQLPEGSGLKATVVAHSLVRVEAEPNAVVGDAPVPLTYQVANSAGSTEGTIRVMVARTDTQFANPVAVPDQAVVRAGDMVMVDVLSNDISPTDAELHLGRILEAQSAEGAGRVEFHQDKVRFNANDDASGEVAVTYEVVDTTGRTGSARLTIRIIPQDAPNSPPRPDNLTARTVAGTPVRIPVPTTGIDPDGDSVMLTGIASPMPTLGEVTEANGEWIEYTPYEGSVGTERFRYQVMDRYGAVGAAEVLVGVAAPHDMNQPPYAVDDIIEARPDRELQIPVLDNDTDPEGAPLSVVADDVEAVTPIEVLTGEQATENMVTVTTPAEAGTHTVLYSASDGSLKSSAAITIKVDPNAPPRSPIARDDFVEASDVMDPEATFIDVDVLANDTDPDGSVKDLKVSLEGASDGAEVRGDNTVRITPQDEQRRYRYLIEDIDDLTSAGYIWVPGSAKQAPVWVGEPVTVQAGGETTVDLSDPGNVRVRPGGSPATITDPSLVTAAHTDGTELVQDASTLRYRAAEGPARQDTITVEVADGEAGDPTSATATLAIPVEITAEDENLPPTLQGALLEAEQGGTMASVDLATLAEDPEGDELTFSLGELTENPGVAITLSGSSVTAQATARAPKGTIIDVPVQVTDGTNDPVTATVQVTVSGSNRPLITTVLDQDEINAGDTKSIDVLRNDSNPFSGGKREIVGASLTGGDGQVVPEGNNVVITPDADYKGILTAQYTVRDDTGDPDRDVSGEIRILVIGKPDPPSAPRVGEVGDGSVELNFTAGNDNGAPITGYRVTSATGPAVSQDCPSTSCTITGLTNDTEYTFQVIAINEVGESEPSVPSATARPDVRPEMPAAPSAERGDSLLTVTWSAPVNRGSAIQRYEVQLQNSATGDVETREVGAGATQIRWEPLTNGTDYRFRVRAFNLAEDPSEWSPWSAPEHPAGRPGKPSGTMTAERVVDPKGGGVTVTWPAMTAAEANGEPITAYILKSSSGKTARVDASARSHTFYDLNRNIDHTFTYTGVNSVGEGTAASASSNAVTPWAQPSPPSNVQASLPDEGTGDGPNGRATVSWSPAEGHGTDIDKYVVTWSGGRQEVDRNATSYSVSGLDNGKAYTFSVQARNRFQGGESALETSNSVTPYTKPDPPRISSSNGNCSDANTCPVTFSINADGGDGGAGGKALQYRVDGGGWQNAGTSYTHKANLKSGGSMSVEARVVNGKGLTSGPASKSQQAKTYNPPNPQVAGGGPNWGTPNGAADAPSCSSDRCTYFTITLENLEPGKQYTVSYKNIHTDGVFREWASFTLTADSNGRATTDQRYYGHWEGTGNPNVVYVNNKEVGRYYSP